MLSKLSLEARENLRPLIDKALAELMQKRLEAVSSLASIDADIMEVRRLTGETRNGRSGKRRLADQTRNGRRGKRRKTNQSRNGKPPIEEIVAALAKSDSKTLQLRHFKWKTAHVRILAAENPGILRLGGKRPWPTVTLLK
jgi:hypothetical protein